MRESSIMLRSLVDRKAPNSDAFRTPDGVLKSLTAVLMADGWDDDPSRVKTCKDLMKKKAIYPALPRGDSHELGDSCHDWPCPPTLQCSRGPPTRPPHSMAIPSLRLNCKPLPCLSIPPRSFCLTRPSTPWLRSRPSLPRF